MSRIMDPNQNMGQHLQDLGLMAEAFGYNVKSCVGDARWYCSLIWSAHWSRLYMTHIYLVQEYYTP